MLRTFSRNLSNKHIKIPISESKLKQQAKLEKDQQDGKRRKKQHIKDQILENKAKKGKIEISIHDEAGVDWFVQKFVDPVHNSGGFKKHMTRKKELQELGLMPKTLEEHMRNVELERAVGRGVGVELGEEEVVVVTDE